MYTITAWFLWQTSVAIGIKGVCYYYLAKKAGQGSCFIFLILRQVLFINIEVKCCCTRGRTSQKAELDYEKPGLSALLPIKTLFYPLPAVAPSFP